jgi:hypothetical protein
MPYWIPSGDDLVKDFFKALGGLFKGNAKEALLNALRSLSDNVVNLNNSNPMLQPYDGAFAIALVCATVASAIQLFRVMKLAEWEALIDVFKPVPITFLVGSSLPYVAAKISSELNKLYSDLGEWAYGKPIDKKTFDYASEQDFGFFSSIAAWVGGKLLDLEVNIMYEWLPFVLLVLALTVGLRWFGFFGDGLFVVFFGLGITILVSPLLMFLIMCFALRMVSGSALTPGYIATAVFIASLVPFIIFGLYFSSSGFKRKVAGMMEARQINTAISSRTHGDAASGGMAGKVAAAGAGALAGSLVASHFGNPRPDDVSRLAHARERTSDSLAQRAMFMTRSNPILSMGLLLGAKALRPRK